MNTVLDSHFTNITNKASKTLGFLRTNLKVGFMTIKEQAYKALVRLTLEFSNRVCDPYLAKNISQQEAVHWVVNRHRQTSSADANTYTQLKWQPLKSCRLQARLAIFFKHHHGVVVIIIPTLHPLQRST